MFVSDSCRFRKNGTCGDNNIVFKGKMSEKKVGNMLPDDYYPDEIVH
jgi:hypothetical protein